jgi:hypothetical protein
MPNVVGPEKMRDVLVQNGIKDPYKLAVVERAIAKHVTWCCHRRHPELYETEEPPAFTKIAPNAKKRTYAGDPERIITCSECGVPKRAEGNYHRRPDTGTGWGLRCKGCIKVPEIRGSKK